MVRFKLLVISAFVLFASSVGAQEDGKGNQEKKPEYPKSGVLSRSTTTGYSSRNFNMPWAKKGDSIAPDEAPPISGSVSKLSDKEWVAKVFNNSKDTYSVSLRVVQRSDAGNFLKSDSFSYTLRPGEKVERRLPAAYGSADTALNLESWKNLSEKKKAAEPSANATPAAGSTPPPPGAPMRR